MNDEDAVIDDIEIENEEETLEAEADVGDIMSDVDPLADFVNSVETGNFVNAEQQFDHAISDRLQQTLDQAKMAIAGRLYNAEQEIEAETDETDS